MHSRATNRQKHIITAALLILLAVVFTLPFVLQFTLAGPAEAPDRTAVYSAGKISWSDGVTSNDMGAATLGLFGEAPEGQDMPLLNSSSEGTYRLRFSNTVSGKVRYYMYLYCENPHNIPLIFEMEQSDGVAPVSPAAYPVFSDGETVLYGVTGEAYSKQTQDFTIHWQWDPAHGDEADTALGVKANEEDLIYTIKVLFAVDDYNTYTRPERFSKDDNGTVMLHEKYINGYEDGSFRPNHSITRSEVAAILSRAFHISASGGVSYPDVPADHWAEPMIAGLSGAGVIEGYPDGSFGPERLITRAEFVTLCVRILEEGRGDSLPAGKVYFDDINRDHWSYEMVEKAVRHGITMGYEDNTFRPDASITRAEAVTMVNRMLGRSADREFVHNMAKTDSIFTDVKDSRSWAYYEIHEAACAHYYQQRGSDEKWMGENEAR